MTELAEDAALYDGRRFACHWKIVPKAAAVVLLLLGAVWIVRQLSETKKASPDQSLATGLSVVRGQETTNKTEETYLGVATSKVDPALATHLGLQRGCGLVVRAVAPDAHAAEVLQIHDVLLKLGDQLLVTPEQLAVLTSNHKPDDVLHLEVLRRGERSQMSVRLSPRPEAAAGTSEMDLYRMLLETRGLRSLKMTRNPSNGQMRASGDFLRPLEEKLDKEELTCAQKESLLGTLRGYLSDHSNSRSRVSSSRSYTLIDNGTSLSLTEVNGKRHLTVKEPDGTTTFDGSINTPKELERVPADIREKLSGLERATRASFGE